MKTAIASLMSLVLSAAAAEVPPPYSITPRTLLLEHFDSARVDSGRRYTRPAAAQQGFAGAALPKAFRHVGGRFGKALEMRGPNLLVYPGQGHVDPTGGQLDMWVRLDFDPNVRTPKTKTIWRNQFFITFAGPGPSRVTLYTVLKSLCVGVWNKQRQLIAYRGHRCKWRQGEWHHVGIRWGQQLELWLDGKQAGAMPWQGLFGPVNVQPDEVRIIVGWKNGIENQFTLDEMRILGPGGKQRARPPLFTIPRLAKPPTIDGRLATGEWNQAGATAGFVHMLQNLAAADQSTVYAGYDAANLYIAVDCRDPKKRPLVAGTTTRDGKVWLDDAVDVFLQPTPDAFPFYQLITNAAGVRYDARVDSLSPRKTDVAFNPKTRVRTSSEPGRWVLEMAVPFAALGLRTPQAGTVWGCNFNRNADAGSADRLSSLAFMNGGWHQPDRFGRMVFSGSARGIRLTDLSDLASGEVRVRVSLTGIAFQPVVRVSATLTDDQGKVLAEMKDKFLDYRSMVFSAPALTTGLYSLEIEAHTDDGNPMLYKRLPFRVQKAFDVSVAAYPYEGKAWITANAKGLPKAAQVKCEITGQTRAIELDAGMGKAAFDLTTLEPGSYSVRAAALDKAGAVLAKVETSFAAPKRPVWCKSKAGIDNTVPPPWTPVEIASGDVRVWGRTYHFAGDALPRQIANQNTSMLAGPVRLRLKTGAATLDVARLQTAVVDTPNDRGVRTGTGHAGKIALTCRTTVEFDGMLRFDMELDPDAGARLDGLALEVPIKKELATFLMPSSGTGSKPIFMPRTTWRSRFLPLVWLGNDDMGLAWFSESAQHWDPLDDAMIEVDPRGEAVILRANMVRKLRTLTRPIRFTFGLMATPVRPLPKNDPFHIRMGWPVANRPYSEFVTYPARGNMAPKQGTLEFWLKPTRSFGSGVRDVFAVNHRTGIRRYGALALQWRGGSPAHLDLVRQTGGKTTTLMSGPAAMPLGTWHHVALTWGGESRLYLDGKLIASTGQSIGLDELAGSGPAERWVDGHPARKLRLGGASEWKRYTWFAYDELRTSRTVRYAGQQFTPPATPFAPDADTLLLDHLDETFRPDGQDGETHAAVIAGAMDEIGGVPSFGCRFGEGKFGRAVYVEATPGRSAKELVGDWGVTCSTEWEWVESRRLKKIKYGWPPYLFEEPFDMGIRKTVKAKHALGVRSVPYFAFYGIGAPTPLSEEFGPEWMRIPKSTTPAAPPKGHHYLAVCGRSGYADYLAAATVWAMDTFDFDGVYTDGNCLVFPCRNTHHGCGYVDGNGDVQNTWPIFATREYFKRIYKIVHAKKPNGLVINHVSYNLFIPVQSFSDVYYTGEHEYYEDLVNNRVRWQGKQWGLFTLLLGASEHIYTPVHFTQALIHGVSVWPHGPYARNDVMRKSVRLWKLYDAFDAKTAEWMPYYRAEAGMARPQSKQIKCSLYLHRGRNALLVIGSLWKEVIETTIALDLTSMGLSGKRVAATNALTLEPMEIEGGKLRVRVLPKSFRLVFVQAE